MKSTMKLETPQIRQPEILSRSQIERIVDEAELPPLLATLAFLLGDDRFVAHDLRPPRGPAQAEIVPQGGMNEEQIRRARELATDGLIRYFAGERTDSVFNPTEIITFLTNGSADGYEEVLRHELGEPSEDRTSVDISHFRVAVIGAGISGLAMSYNLSRENVSHTVFEKNDSLGGTWNDNQYPGCRLDTSNFAYSFSFAQKHDWPDQFSLRRDIWDYVNSTANRLGLLDHIRLGTTVESINFCDETQSWAVVYVLSSGRKETEYFDAVVSAVGQLNVPKLPDIPGIDDFEGTWCHSARWPSDMSIKDKRVAVVGTGASAYQIVPAIVEDVKQLSVVQRSAPWMMPTPGYQEPLRSGMSELLNLMPEYGKWLRFWQFWLAAEGRMSLVIADDSWDRENNENTVSAANKNFRDQLASHMLRQYEDRPDLAKKIIPNYPPGAKRLLRDDGSWAKALKSPQTKLVTEAIERITPAGILFKNGHEEEYDVIVYATGFRASDFLDGIQVTGVDQRDLHEYWAGEARAYKGVCVPGFPGFHLLYGPNTGLVVTGSAIFMSECAAEYSIELLRETARRGEGPLDVTEEAYKNYIAELDAANKRRAWGVEGVRSWYKNASGVVTQNWPFSLKRFYEDTHTLDSAAHLSLNPTKSEAKE